ncbi:MAG: hypothetical protein Fur0022_07300 [Anaerolineales bacterium]
MTANLGEEIVAAYLEYIKGCEFIQQNLYTPDVQGVVCQELCKSWGLVSLFGIAIFLSFRLRVTA